MSKQQLVRLENWQNIPEDFLKNRFLVDLGCIDCPTRKTIRDVVSKVGGSVLDVGCGPGQEYAGFKKYHLPIKYVGMDVTQKIIDIARKKFPEARFELGDVLNINYPDNSFDVVICRHILEHLPGYEKAIKEMVRVSRNTVIIVLYKPLTENKEDGFNRTEYAGKKFWTNSYSKEKFYTFLRALGVNFEHKIVIGQDILIIKK